MGLTTRNLLLAVLVASVPLAVCGFLPWYDFGWFERSGTDARVFTRLGDGYVVAALAVFCGFIAIQMLTAGRVTLFPALALLAGALASAMFVITNLAYDSDVCNGDSILGFTSGPKCSTGGDLLPTSSHGNASIFLWWAAALSMFIAIAALALPLTAGLEKGSANGTEGQERWE